MKAMSHQRILPGGTRWRRRVKDVLVIPQLWVPPGCLSLL